MASGDATREKLRAMLREGKLDDREVEVELADDANPLMSVLGGQPGIDESALKDELSGLRTGRASAHLLDPVMAAFNIGALVRWLDFNDTWLAAEWGHPSDNLGGILGASFAPSLAQVLEASGGVAWVGYYIAVAGVISFLAVFSMRETRG